MMRIHFLQKAEIAEKSTTVLSSVIQTSWMLTVTVLVIYVTVLPAAVADAVSQHVKSLVEVEDAVARILGKKIKKH
jgi:hypothetical protein